jgi:hypothetical protein
MPVYVLLKKTRVRNFSLPNFELYSHPPPVEQDQKQKILVIEDDHYVDVARFSLSKDLSYVNVEEHRITNTAEIITEEILERYTLAVNIQK